MTTHTISLPPKPMRLCWCGTVHRWHPAPVGYVLIDVDEWTVPATLHPVHDYGVEWVA